MGQTYSSRAAVGPQLAMIAMRMGARELVVTMSLSLVDVPSFLHPHAHPGSLFLSNLELIVSIAWISQLASRSRVRCPSPSSSVRALPQLTGASHDNKLGLMRIC